MSPVAKFWSLFGMMLLLLFWALLIPMRPPLLVFLLIVVICLALFLLSVQLDVLLIRGAALSPRWRRRLQRLRKFGWTIWVVRAVIYSGMFWLFSHQAYEAGIMLAMLMLVVGFAKPLIRHQLAQWS